MCHFTVFHVLFLFTIIGFGFLVKSFFTFFCYFYMHSYFCIFFLISPYLLFVASIFLKDLVILWFCKI